LTAIWPNSPGARDRLITWIDLNAPFHGTWSETGRSPGEQRRRRAELRKLFVMGDRHGEIDEWPPARVKIERPFWIGACEVTNEQFARFDPGHDSRFESKNGYRPNAWGLHDMHGNVAEWTRSCYRPYPYTPGSERDGDGDSAPGRRVVRGGWWRDRPKRCRAGFRLSYPAWQGVYNVGFRVLCEAGAATLPRTSIGVNDQWQWPKTSERDASGGIRSWGLSPNLTINWTSASTCLAEA